MMTSIYKISSLSLVFFILLGCSSSKQLKQNYKDIEIKNIDWTPPQFEEINLENGLDCIVITDDEVPLIDFYLAFPAPSDPGDMVGLAEMTTYCLRNGGSTEISADSINMLLEFSGAYLGIYAGQEQLRISGFCLRDDLDKLLNIVKSLMESPSYPEDIQELKRSTMIEGIKRSNDNPRVIMRREISKLLYPDHPWGWNKSVNSVQTITREKLFEYHKNVFQPQDAVFGIAGDISAEEAHNFAENNFNFLSDSKVLVNPLPDVPPAAETGIYHYQKDVNQAFVTMGHQTIKYDDPDRHASIIMNYILGAGGKQSMLMRKIRVDEGLAYSVWSSYSTPFPVVGTFRANSSTRLNEAGRTLGLMKQVISDFAENGPSEEQFIHAKKSYINSYVWKYENTDDYLSRLVYLKWRGLPLDTPQRDLKMLEKLTLDDIKKAAKKLLKPDNLITVVVGDKSKLDQPLEDFGTVFNINSEE